MAVNSGPALAMATDERPSEFLAREAQGGDARALTLLLEHHKHEVFRVALRMTGRPHDADEVVQLSLERVIKHLRSYDVNRPFRPWILRITVNQARTFLRRRNLRELFLGAEASPDLAVASSDSENHLRRQDLRGELEQALQQLPQNQREAFVLKHVEELSYEEIAEITGDSVGSLKVRVHRARRTLVDLLRTRRVTSTPGREY